MASALTGGIDPAGNTAARILDDLVERYAKTFQTTDTPKYRNALLRRLEIANDPRTERYVTLLHVMAARGASLGVAALCIGGGQGVAMVIER